ncbi:MAG TPA: hypothetical protein VIL50_00020, partial [Candidatus Limnocylindrales bacterium]
EQQIGETLPTPLPRLPHEGDSPDAATDDQAGAEAHELRSKPRRTFRQTRQRTVPGKRRR